MKKELLEVLLGKALTALIEQNGGSMEQALDDMKIVSKKDRKAIKKWFGWEEEDELPTEDEIRRPGPINTDKQFEDYIRNYLEYEYGSEVESFVYEFDMSRIYIYNIIWKED